MAVENIATDPISLLPPPGGERPDRKAAPVPINPAQSAKPVAAGRTPLFGK
jgi:hypothetical protein